MAACGAPPPALTGEGLEASRAMVALVERGAEITAFAHPLEPSNAGLSLDLDGADRLNVLLYTAPLEALALRAGPLALAAAGRPLPSAARAFRLELGDPGLGWRALDPLPPPLSTLRLDTRCTGFTAEELPVGRPGREARVMFIAPAGGGRAVVGTRWGELSWLSAAGSTPILTLSGVATSAAWVQPGTSKLWLNAGAELVSLDLETEEVRRAAPLPDFLVTMTGPTDPADPFELFMVTNHGRALWSDGVEVRDIGGVSGLAPTDRVRVARWAPGRALLTTATATVAELTPDGMARAYDPFDDACFPERGKVTFAALFDGALVMARACRVSNADTQILRRVGADGRWTLAQQLLVGGDLYAVTPLLGGALFAGASSHLARLLPDGTPCAAETYGMDERTPHHFVVAVALDERTVALAGPPVAEEVTLPPRVVLLRYAP